MLLIAYIMLGLCASMAVGLSIQSFALSLPKPKAPKPAPALERPQLELPELPFDASAFWNYPDWSGPLKEPFWMRPLKIPEPRETVLRAGDATPIPVTYGTARLAGSIKFCGFSEVPDEPHAFMIINGEKFVETVVDGKHRMERLEATPERLAVEQMIKERRELGTIELTSLAIQAALTPDEQRRLSLQRMREHIDNRHGTHRALILE